jgi:type II secretory pathway component GspD/PulD (secretin)
VLGLAAKGLAAELPELQKADALPVNVVKILRTNNKAHTHRYVPKVYDIQNNNPFALLRWVRRVAQIEEGGYWFFGKKEDGKVTSGKILMILPEHMVPGVDKLMQTIDRPGLTSTSGEKFFYFRPKYRHISNDAEPEFRDLVKAIVKWDGETGGPSTSGDTAFDTEANKVLVYAAPSKGDDLREWLPYIDTPPKQVMIEATVYEIYVDNESKIGLDYVAWKNGPGQNLFATGLFLERGETQVLDGGPELVTGVGSTAGMRNTGSNVAWYLNVPAAFYDYLVVKGKARVMSSAKIDVLNNRTGVLRSTDTVVYYKADQPSASEDGERDAGDALDPDDREVEGDTRARSMTAFGFSYGVYLDVTPIIAENEIDLEVETRVVNHIGFDSDEDPILNAREADTHIRCRDGQEIVLGGLTREMVVQRTDKMPFFGSLPYIGSLFGGESTAIERRQVVVVLVPHVIRDYSAMRYAGTKIDAAMIKAQARRERELKVPRTEAGFDQWLLDPEEE